MIPFESFGRCFISVKHLVISGGLSWSQTAFMLDFVKNFHRKAEVM